MKHKDWIYLSRQMERATTREEAEAILEEIRKLELSDYLDQLQGRSPCGHGSTKHTDN